MTEQTLRRNLDTAHDPGPDFPDRLLLSRTMALVRAEAAATVRRGRLKRGERWPLIWLRQDPGLVQRLQPVVAILLMAMLALASVALFFLVHQPRVPARPFGGAVIVPTKMVSPTTGWAVVPPKLWRTGDGGAHWREVSPPSLPARETQSPGESQFFLDGNHAWVAEIGLSADGGPGGYASVFRTSDGGRTWQQGESVPDPELAVATSVYFIDSMHGWFLMSEANPTNLGAPPTLYSTSDGGLHWKLTSSGAARPNSWCGQHMSFATVNTGWIASECDQEVPIVSVTHDGGATWQVQRLPLTTAHASCPCYFQNPPQIFDGLHGIFVLYGLPGALLVTSDGGTTWIARALPGEEQMAVDFVDPGHGWAVGGSSSQLNKTGSLTAPSGPLPLYQTDDGGATWNLLQTNLLQQSQEGRIGPLYFVDQNDGFAVRGDSNGPTQFLKTTDGGRTWTVVVTSQPQP